MTSVEPPGKVPREVGDSVWEMLCPQMVNGPQTTVENGEGTIRPVTHHMD